MDIMTYSLPVTNVVEMDRTALELMSAQRNGVDLPVEVRDWLDHANNVVLGASGNQEI